MTPLSRITTVICALGIMLLPQASHAQTGATMTGSTLEEETRMRAEEMWNERRSAIAGFRAAALNARKEESVRTTQQAERRAKRAELLLQCNKDIRAANRDTVFRETMRCFRALVTSDMELIRKEQQTFGIIAGVSTDLREAAGNVAQNLMDALATVTSAVDADVYRSKEDLLEAKKNLRQKYREPFRDALLALRLSRRTMWVTLLLVNLHDALDEEGLPESVLNATEEAIACLENAKDFLTREEPGNRSQALRESDGQLRLCTKTIRDAHSLYKEFEQSKTESGSAIK